MLSCGVALRIDATAAGDMGEALRPRASQYRIARPYNSNDDWSYEETDDPLYADRRDFYKVENWSRDGQRIGELLFAE
jgi:hypothetical protein